MAQPQSAQGCAVCGGPSDLVPDPRETAQRSDWRVAACDCAFLWPRKEKLLAQARRAGETLEATGLASSTAQPCLLATSTEFGRTPPLSAQERLPILEHRLQPGLPHGGGHFPTGRSSWIANCSSSSASPRHSPRLGARLGRHLGDAKAHRAVAEGGRLASRKRQVQRWREETPGADKLRQLAIRHHNLRLQPTGAGAQAREGERVAALPVVALKPAQVLGDKVAVGAPV